MSKLKSEILPNSIPDHWKDPADFHNEAIDVYRRGGDNPHRDAFEVILRGLELYPYDIDLLADAIQWGPVGKQENWQLQNLAEFYCDHDVGGLANSISIAFEEKLRSIGTAYEDIANGFALNYTDDILAILCTRMEYWNWRAYDFAIDYLVDKRAAVVKSVAEVGKTLEMAQNLARRFSNTKIDMDRSKSAEAKVLLAMRKYSMAKDTLSEAIGAADTTPMPSCCIRLIDLLMDEGKLEEAIKIADVGIRSTAQTQPGASVGYFVYCKAIAYEALYLETDGADPYTLEEVANLYKTAYRVLGNDSYRRNIETRTMRLGISLTDSGGKDRPGLEDRVSNLERSFGSLDRSFRSIIDMLSKQSG